jgi:5-hydroxyisourate hydrolase
LTGWCSPVSSDRSINGDFRVPGVSIHVVDVSRGVVACGMRVELHALTSGPSLIVAGLLSAQGLLDSPVLNQTLKAGFYEARFHVADYYRMVGTALDQVPFLDVVDYRFGIENPAQHYHLPFKVTPWGYSCFRGGA